MSKKKGVGLKQMSTVELVKMAETAVPKQANKARMELQRRGS